MLHPSIAGILVGVLGTLVMDLGGVIALRLGLSGQGPRRNGPALLGRWIGYLGQGKLRHDDILHTPPLRWEIPLGVVSHYAIGMVLGLGYLMLLQTTHVRSSVLTGLGYGVATTVFSLFFMFPSQGMGWMASRLPGAARLSLINHAFFGLGLWLWTMILKPL